MKGDLISEVLPLLNKVTYFEDTEVVYIPRPKRRKLRPGALPALLSLNDSRMMEHKLQVLDLHGIRPQLGSPTLHSLRVPWKS